MPNCASGGWSRRATRPGGCRPRSACSAPPPRRRRRPRPSGTRRRPPTPASRNYSSRARLTCKRTRRTFHGPELATATGRQPALAALRLGHRRRRRHRGGLGPGPRHALGPAILAPGLALPDAAARLAAACQPGAATAAGPVVGAHDRAVLVLVQGVLQRAASAERARVLDDAGRVRRTGDGARAARAAGLLRRPVVRDRLAQLAE